MKVFLQMTKKHFYFLFFILFFSFSFYSQVLSEGYKEIKLGMVMTEVESLIKSSPEFYSGREEVLSIRLEPDTQIITAEGTGFIKIAYFHFNEDKLFQIFLILSEKKIGYYTLLKRLTTKFGTPSDLDPLRAYWQNATVKIVIEKPCTIKYLYLPIWNTLLDNNLDERKILDKIREDFVDDL